jgi:hypothetical protein
VFIGLAHEDKKVAFLAELGDFGSAIDVPYIVGGDFNILRHVLQKKKPAFYLILQTYSILSSIICLLERFI